MIRYLALYFSSLVQYLRIRLRNKSQLKQNDLAYICSKKPFILAREVNELIAIMNFLRPFARRVAPDQLCLDMSLVLINMSGIPAEIHFSVKRNAKSFIGHAWVEAKDTILSTDYDYHHDSVWSWEKPIDAI